MTGYEIIEEASAIFLESAIPVMKEVLWEGLDRIKEACRGDGESKGKESQAGIRALLGRMDSKLDRILEGEGGKVDNKILHEIKDHMSKVEKYMPGGEETGKRDENLKSCFFCNGKDHIIRNCPKRTRCMGCDTMSHPYERCDFKDKVCDRCKVKGHCKKVHFTLDTALRTKLVGAFPQSFTHFVAAAPALQAQGSRSNYKGPRVGLSKDHYTGHDSYRNHDEEQEYASEHSRSEWVKKRY